MASEKKEVAVAPNELDKVAFKQLGENQIEVRLETVKLLPSAPILFEKAKNVYFISLPSTAYNGDRKLKLKQLGDSLKDVTIDFIPYKISDDNGYTRIVIETKGDTSLKVLNVESLGSKGIAILLISAFFGLIAVTVCLAGGYYTYKRLSSKRDFNRILNVEPVMLETVDDELVDDTQNPDYDESQQAEDIILEAENVMEQEDGEYEVASEDDEYIVEDEEVDGDDFYPSADEMVTDILNNEEALSELSEVIAAEVEEQSDNMPISEQEEVVIDEESGFDAVSFAPSSAGVVFESKVFNFAQPEQDEDEYEPENNDYVIEDDIEEELIPEAENIISESTLSEEIFEMSEELEDDNEDLNYSELAQEDFSGFEEEVEYSEEDNATYPADDDDSVFDDIVSGEVQVSDYEDSQGGSSPVFENNLDNEYVVEANTEIIEEGLALQDELPVLDLQNMDVELKEDVPVIAENIQSEEDVDDEEDEPEVLAAQGITDDKAIYLIKQSGVYSLLGTVGDDAFLLNTFEKEPDDTNITLFENEEKENEVVYIVKVGSWRALISIKNDSMENILTLS